MTSDLDISSTISNRSIKFERWNISNTIFEKVDYQIVENGHIQM
jgi:hypothetical protein